MLGAVPRHLHRRRNHGGNSAGVRAAGRADLPRMQEHIPQHTPAMASSTPDATSAAPDTSWSHLHRAPVDTQFSKGRARESDVGAGMEASLTRTRESLRTVRDARAKRVWKLSNTRHG